MAKYEYFTDDCLVTEGREKIAQKIVDVLVKHNLSNFEANVILDIASNHINLLRITNEHVPPIT